MFSRLAPSFSPAVTPGSSRTGISGISSRTAFLDTLLLGSVVLNYDLGALDIGNLVTPQVYHEAVANTQLNQLLPIFTQRFFPVYMLCNSSEGDKNGVGCKANFQPFIFENGVLTDNSSLKIESGGL